MFSSFGNSWQLVKASWAVLRADKELLWFPVLSTLALIAITITFFLPLAGIFTAFGFVANNESVSGVIGVVLLFIYYLISYSVAYYFNTALVGAAMIRIDGGDPTLRDGLRIAGERMGIIIQYAVISATVGVILRMIQERGGIIGRLVAGLGSFAWNVATFLVVPVLVMEEVTPIDAIKRSGRMLRETWGEQLVFNFGIGAFFGLIQMLLVAVAIALGFVAFEVLGATWLVVVVVVLAIGATILLATISSAMNGIFQASLYRYAASGVVPDEFDIRLIEGAFKHKKKH